MGRIRLRQPDRPRGHGLADLARRRVGAALDQRCRVDGERRDAGGADLAAGVECILERQRPPEATAARDVGTPVGHEHDEGRASFAAQAIGEFECGIEAGGNGRAAAAGETGEKLFGAGERAGWGQDDLGPRAAEGDEGDAVAAHVAVREQQLDGALDLGEPMDRR